MRYDPGKFSRPQFLGGGDWCVSNFTPITLLLGRNGAGKSVLLRQWQQNRPDEVHYINPERSGNMSLDANVSTQLLNNNRMITNTNIDAQYRQKSVSQIQLYLTTFAVNNGNVLFSIEDLTKYLNIVLPGYGFEIIDRSPFWKGKRVDTGLEITNGDQLSSGESQILSMTLDILTQYGRCIPQEDTIRTLLIDEPDAHIHPDIQMNFCKLINLMQKRVGMNVVVASHSLEIISGFALHCPDRTSIAIMRPRELNVISTPLDDLKIETLTAFGGGVLMGRVFGAKLVLVEGDDDHDMWSQAARHGVLEITAIPCGGGERLKKKQKQLERLFSGLRDPRAEYFGVALLDGDKKLPISPQSYIEYKRLSCRESENLILTDEVRSKIGLSWDEMISKLVLAAKGNQKRKIRSLTYENRAFFDLKGLMPLFESTIFPVMGRWTRIVGNVLGPIRPSGDIASFLGEDVVNSLYGEGPGNCDSLLNS